MDGFLDLAKTPKLNREEANNLNRHIPIKIQIVIKSIQLKNKRQNKKKCSLRGSGCKLSLKVR